MIIDLGSENTDLIIADGETIWLRSIPVGGKNFTDILVKQFKLPFAKAEELKRTAATSKYAKQIFQAMRPVFADLVAEVQRSIGFYASVHRDSRLKRVLALGGTFRLPGLQKYLQQNLQLEVARIDRLEAGGPEEAKQRAAFEENLLSLASAYGLAIQAMGDAKITSSLLPASIRREKMWSDKTPWFAATAGREARNRRHRPKIPSMEADPLWLDSPYHPAPAPPPIAASRAPLRQIRAARFSSSNLLPRL